MHLQPLLRPQRTHNGRFRHPPPQIPLKLPPGGISYPHISTCCQNHHPSDNTSSSSPVQYWNRPVSTRLTKSLPNFALLAIEAWRFSWRQRQRLVVLNACESADYTPDDFDNLIRAFWERGAAGVVGTQCSVLERLADAFMLSFLADFLQQKAAGEALYRARRRLLMQPQPDPRGLAYSLFATADVQLGERIF